MIEEHKDMTKDQIIDHLMSKEGGYWPLALIFDYLKKIGMW
jgi:hypothetical protein